MAGKCCGGATKKNGSAAKAGKSCGTKKPAAKKAAK
jgi:hypothetical protein